MQTVKHQTPLSLVNTLCSLNCSSNSFSNSLGDSKGESWGIEGQIFVRKYFPLLHVSCLRKSWVSIIWEQLVLQEEKCYTVGGTLSMGSSFALDIRQALSGSASEQSSKNFFSCRQEATSSNFPGLGWHRAQYHITEERGKPASQRGELNRLWSRRNWCTLLGLQEKMC